MGGEKKVVPGIVWRLLTFLLVLALGLFAVTGCDDISVQDVVDVIDTIAEISEEDAAPTATQQPSVFATPSSVRGEEARAATPQPEQTFLPEETAALEEGGCYTAKEDVALYTHTYGRLPDNFITKAEAKKLGWPGGSLEPYAPGMCIGGDRFGNYEGLLPQDGGRTYMECDIDTLGSESRGAKRIVFSNDGLIFYTEDHYESFTQLY